MKILKLGDTVVTHDRAGRRGEGELTVLSHARKYMLSAYSENLEKRLNIKLNILQGGFGLKNISFASKQNK